MAAGHLKSYKKLGKAKSTSNKRLPEFLKVQQKKSSTLPCHNKCLCASSSMFKASKAQACVFLGRNCCHVLREIPAIGFVISALKRVAADSLDPSAQVSLNIQCIPHSYVLTTSFVQVIDQDIVKLFNRRSAVQITGQRNIE